MLVRQYVVYGLLVLLVAGMVGTLLFPAVPAVVWTVAVVAAAAAIGVLDDFRRGRERVIRDAAEAVRRLSAGKFGDKLYAGGSPALADLARAMNATAETLAGRIDRLESERQRLLAVLGGMVEGVVALDRRQTVLFANDRAGQLLGFVPSPAAGRRLWEVVRQRRLQEIVEQSLAGPNPIREELEWPGPTARHIAIYAARLSGPEPGAVLVLHDTSDLRRLERLRQDFVANVSHELKTPLAVIKACVETLIDGAATDTAACSGFLTQINDQADRLHNLVLDLLHLARIESDDAPLALHPVPLAETAAHCVARHQARAESKDQQLQADGPPLAVQADDEALDTVLENLVDNALKYTPAGGRVTVRWVADDSMATIAVEDTGIGIPERDLPRLFERFYRVDRARSRELGGTGLGLSIVKHLVQAMGGSVEVRSTVGRGSTFTVVLPLAAECREAISPSLNIHTASIKQR